MCNASPVALAMNELRQAGFRPTFVHSEDPCCDDDIDLNGTDDLKVQVGRHADGVWFVGCYYSGEGDDFGVTQGNPTRDAVTAANDALRFQSANA